MLTGRAATARARNANTGKNPHLPPRPPRPPTELQVEAVPLSHDDLSFTPSKFTHSGLTWGGSPLFFWWGYITGIEAGTVPGLAGDGQNPILVIRSWNNTTNLGSLNHTECQPGLFRPGIPQAPIAGTTFSGVSSGYQKIPGDPDNLGGPNEHTYQVTGTAADGRSYRYNAGTRGYRVRETARLNGNLVPLLDLRMDYYPLTPTIWPPAPFNLYHTGAAIAQGKYRGVDVWFSAGFDWFKTSDVFASALANPLYMAFVYSGIHNDGKKEWGASYITGQDPDNFASFGVYCKDGDEPICTHDVQFEGTWVHNVNDPSQIRPLEMTYYLEQGGRKAELHFEATHSTGNQAVGRWWSKKSSKTFARQMTAIESGIDAGSVPTSPYTPLTTNLP